MPRDIDGPDDRGRFLEKYARPRSEAARQVERAVLGREVGLSGYTTIEQAQTLNDQLSLLPGGRLLDVGAGRGWPGSYLAQSSGCHLVASDVPLDALRAAGDFLQRGAPRGKADAVSADGRALPFRPTCFDAVVHADVFC